jgi:hypothetical protein
LRIVACYPRAVKWLFSAAGAAIKTDSSQSESSQSDSNQSDAKQPVYIEVVNMRTDSADTVCAKLGIGKAETTEGAESQATGVSP